MSNLTWRFLIVEDNPDIARQLAEIAPHFVDPPDETEVKLCAAFPEASKFLKSETFDLLILDLKDNNDSWFGADEELAGLKVFECLKKTRFLPVIFYTAFAHKVQSLQTSFVRVLKKPDDDVTKVRDEVRKVMATHLPRLSRTVEEIQRVYMWEFVSSHWSEFESPHEQAEITYLMARRLALSLETEARRLAKNISGVPTPADAKIHPMQMYVRPPIASCRMAGDILCSRAQYPPIYYVVLTPSCDFEQKNRLSNVLIAECVPLSAEPEFVKWKGNPNSQSGPLRALIGDNREKAQSDRFKFLPGTYFFPDSVVDFQRLQALPPPLIEKMDPIASLDSPYAEALLARFSRYFGRLGTTDLDKDVVINRLATAPQKPTPAADVNYEI
jgi:CheY-like chemotaxis protein